MKKRNIYFIGLLIVVMVFGNIISTFAAEETSTMMCDEGVVKIGDTDADVREKCGEPNSKTVNEWIYNFDPTFTVIFKERKVLRILEGE
jgi:hypothetical protein